MPERDRVGDILGAIDRGLDGNLCVACGDPNPDGGLCATCRAFPAGVQHGPDQDLAEQWRPEAEGGPLSLRQRLGAIDFRVPRGPVAFAPPTAGVMWEMPDPNPFPRFRWFPWRRKAGREVES